VAAEQLGHPRFGTAEGWTHDAVVLLAQIAGVTSRMGLATTVLPVWSRTPAAIAMAATSLQRASGGRFALGLGAGSPPLVEDPEGFSTQAELFDQDFTKGRLPRAAIALTGWGILAVACDGRAPEEAGLTLSEFAQVLVELRAQTALNLDGGSSASLIAGGERRNTPRDDEGQELTPGEPVPTAVLLNGQYPRLNARCGR
jgi:hypothetical protein